MKKSAAPILGLLTIQPMSGYDMKQAIEISLGHFWSESFGQIYPQLRALSREGLICEIPPNEPESDRPRRVYEITSTGRAALRDWLEREPTEQVMRNELLLKIFFATECDPAAIRDHCEGARARALKEIAELEKVEKMLDTMPYAPRKVAYWRITARFGLHNYRAMLAWSEETMQALDSPPIPHEGADNETVVSGNV